MYKIYKHFILVKKIKKLKNLKNDKKKWARTTIYVYCSISANTNSLPTYRKHESTWIFVLWEKIWTYYKITRKLFCLTIGLCRMYRLHYMLVEYYILISYQSSIFNSIRIKSDSLTVLPKLLRHVVIIYFENVWLLCNFLQLIFIDTKAYKTWSK